MKFALDDFTLWYDGSDYYSTLLTEAQSLYDNNSDWAENADALQTAITEASGKETVADKNSAIFALQTAMQTFKDANTVDMTTRLVNPNFDSNISGWVTSGSDGTWQRQTSTQNNYSGGFIETWRNGWNGTWNHKNLDMHQVLTSLPSGEYTVKAAIGAVMQGSSETQGSSAYGAHYHGGPYYVDDNHGAWLYATSGETTTTTWANTENNNIATGTGPEYFTTTINVTNGSLTIGAKAIGSDAGGTTIGTYTNWFSSDNWTLSYFGFDPSTLKDNISDLKTDVQAIIDGDEVPTAVKTSLQNTLDDLVETPETKTVLDAAVNTLEDAISAANATKTPYAAVKALIDFVTEEKTNSTGTKTTIEAAINTVTTNIETRTTAAALDEDYNTLETARQTYVTSGAQPTADHVFDYTFKIADAAVTSATDWTNKRTNSGQQYTGAPDNTYFDTYNENRNIQKNIGALRLGKYELKCATRADVGVTIGNIYVSQNGANLNQTNINHAGNTGGDLGNGWSWTTVNFDNYEDSKDITLGFYSECGSSKWAGADDFHLYYKGNAIADDVANALKETVVSGKMNTAVASNQATALSNFESAQTFENYNALKAAIDNASASKTAYTKLKGELDKMDATFGALVTNIYSATDYATNYSDVKDNYDDGSISTDDANAYAYGERVTGAMPAIMLSSWKVGEEAALTDASLYMNAWSTEGNSDGSEMTTPFYEYWVSDANALEEKTFTAIVEGLTPGTNYLVSAKVRVRQQNDQTKADDDVTFQVNDGDVVNAADGTQSAIRSEVYYKTVRAFGDADGDGKLTIKVVVKDGNHINWLAFKDVHYSVVSAPTDAHKTALNTALAAAEAKVIGFAAGEYAPYTNIDACKALAAAKAIDVDVNTDYEVVAATTALTGSTWNENAEEMNAVSDELFNGTEYGTAGWTRTQTWNNTGTGIYSVPAGTMTYGDVAYHEMPLEGNTVYKLTFGHRRWDGGNADNGGQVSVLNGSGEGLAFTSYTGTSEQSLQNEYYYFRTGAAGNYTFTVTATSGRLTFGNVVLKKAVIENVTIAETDETAPAHKYADVTLTRTLSASYWNTFSVPFDAAIPDGWTVKEFDNATDNVISFKNATSFVAGKPYLVSVTADVENPTFNNVIVKNTEGSTDGEGNYKFAAQIFNKSLATDGTIAYLATDGKIKKLNTASGLKGLRAYFIIPAGAAARINFIDDETTGISRIENSELRIENSVYNLQGQRVNKAQKGLYIKNGKKVVKK